MVNNKKKLALIKLPETKGVLFDALVTFVGEARGEEVDEIHLANMADAIMVSLKRQYQPVVQNPRQMDLEELIKICKNVPIPGSEDMSRLGTMPYYKSSTEIGPDSDGRYKWTIPLDTKTKENDKETIA